MHTSTVTVWGVTEAAEFTAELIRQGIVFTCVSDKASFTFRFTGGY